MIKWNTHFKRNQTIKQNQMKIFPEEQWGKISGKCNVSNIFPQKKWN